MYYCTISVSFFITQQQVPSVRFVLKSFHGQIIPTTLGGVAYNFVSRNIYITKYYILGAGKNYRERKLNLSSIKPTKADILLSEFVFLGKNIHKLRPKTGGAKLLKPQKGEYRRQPTRKKGIGIRYFSKDKWESKIL